MQLFHLLRILKLLLVSLNVKIKRWFSFIKIISKSMKMRKPLRSKKLHRSKKSSGIYLELQSKEEEDFN